MSVHKHIITPTAPKLPQLSPPAPTGQDDNAIAAANAAPLGTRSPVRSRLLSYNDSPDARAKREAFSRASYSPGSLSPVKKSTRTGGWATNASRASRTIPDSFEPISSTTGSESASSALLPPETIYDLLTSSFFYSQKRPSHWMEFATSWTAASTNRENTNPPQEWRVSWYPT